MQLDSERLDVIKQCLQDAPCNFYGGDMVCYTRYPKLIM